MKGDITEKKNVWREIYLFTLIDTSKIPKPLIQIAFCRKTLREDTATLLCLLQVGKMLSKLSEAWNFSISDIFFSRTSQLHRAALRFARREINYFRNRQKLQNQVAAVEKWDQIDTGTCTSPIKRHKTSSGKAIKIPWKLLIDTELATKLLIRYQETDKNGIAVICYESLRSFLFITKHGTNYKEKLCEFKIMKSKQ